MKKNLVYYSVGIKDVYADLVKTSISSIDFSNDGPIDILIITDQDFFNKNFRDFERKNTKYHIVDKIQSSDEVFFNKLKGNPSQHECCKNCKNSHPRGGRTVISNVQK